MESTEKKEILASEENASWLLNVRPVFVCAWKWNFRGFQEQCHQKKRKKKEHPSDDAKSVEPEQAWLGKTELAVLQQWELCELLIVMQFLPLGMRFVCPSTRDLHYLLLPRISVAVVYCSQQPWSEDGREYNRIVDWLLSCCLDRNESFIESSCKASSSQQPGGAAQALQSSASILCPSAPSWMQSNGQSRTGLTLLDLRSVWCVDHLPVFGL